MLKIAPPLCIGATTEDGKTWVFELAFRADAFDALTATLSRAWTPVNGFAIQAVIEDIASFGDPPWLEELEFASCNDRFCVRCERREPLAYLARRLERRIWGTSVSRLVKRVS